MLIWIILSIALVVIVAGGYTGQRRYRSKGGGAGDNPRSHNAGRRKSAKQDHRGRGSPN